jgi:hypothetical protein
MPVGGFGLGFSGALADYMQQERARQRQQEDQQTNYQMELIKSLAARPDINDRPEIMGQAIHDLMALSQSKGGQGKLKGGMAGFMGQHELPMSQFLSGLASGARPISGPTMEPNVEQPSESTAAALTRMPAAPSTPVGQPTPEAPTGGTSILSAPIAMPPMSVQGPASAARMVEAGRGMQMDAAMNPAPPPQMRPVPSERQPYFISPEERAARAGDIKRSEAQRDRSAVLAQRKQEVSGLPGMTPHDQTRYILTGQDAATQLLKGQQSKKLGVMVSPDGTQRAFAVDTFDPNTGKHTLTSEDGMTPIPPDWEPLQPTMGKGAAGGSQYQQHLVQQPDGSYELIYGLKDPTATASPAQPQAGTAQPTIPPAPKQGVITAPTGVKGKLPQPPQGQVVVMANPEGQAQPYRVNGTNAKPINLPGGQAGVKPIAPEKMSAQGKQALVGINVVNQMIPGLLTDLQKMGLSNNPIGQSWSLALAKRGISPGQAEESLLQTLGIADAYGLRGLMGGRPNQSLMDIVRIHLPQPGDSTQLSWDKLHTLQTQLEGVRKAIMDAESAKLPQANPYTGEVKGAAPSAEQDLMNFLKGGK